MPFKNGKSGNPHGRPKGSANNANKELKEILKGLMENEIMNLDKRLNTLNDYQRLIVITKLLPFVLPKLRDIEEDVYKEYELPTVIIKRKSDMDRSDKS